LTPGSEHHRSDKRDLRLGVVTVSTSRSAAAADGREVKDESGDRVCSMAKERGFRVTFRKLVSDDVNEIRLALTEGLATGLVDGLVFVGGTGVSPADVTPEAVAPLMDKELPGFGELFRRKSSDAIGGLSVLSRATAGVCRGAGVFCLPGSPDGSALGMGIVLEMLPHLTAISRPAH
jgi:molybdenum cofactor biosynthesis protein B